MDVSMLTLSSTTTWALVKVCMGIPVVEAPLHLLSGLIHIQHVRI